MMVILSIATIINTCTSEHMLLQQCTCTHLDDLWCWGAFCMTMIMNQYEVMACYVYLLFSKLCGHDNLPTHNIHVAKVHCYSLSHCGLVSCGADLQIIHLQANTHTVVHRYIQPLEYSSDFLEWTIKFSCAKHLLWSTQHAGIIALREFPRVL